MEQRLCVHYLSFYKSLFVWQYHQAGPTFTIRHAARELSSSLSENCTVYIDTDWLYLIVMMMMFQSIWTSEQRDRERRREFSPFFLLLNPISITIITRSNIQHHPIFSFVLSKKMNVCTNHIHIFILYT